LYFTSSRIPVRQIRIFFDFLLPIFDNKVLRRIAGHGQKLLAIEGLVELVSKKKLVIIGIDAADYGLVSKLLENQELPRLSRMAGDGNFSCLKSVMPPNTAPGWTSITTGVNPGKHGIYYFYNFSTSPPTIINSTNGSAPRIWDYVGASGGRSVVVNVPITYPVTEITGSIVSGIPPWYIDERAVSPVSLLKTLQDRHYEIDTPMSRALEKRPEILVNRLLETEERRVETFLSLLREEGEKWSFAMIVITALDRLQHKLVGKGKLEDDQVRRGYREVDKMVGRIVDELGPEVNYLIVSDHGFAKTPIAFYPNAWLYKAGLLVRKSSFQHRMFRAVHNLFDGHLLWLPLSLTKRFQGGNANVPAIDAVDLLKSRAFVPGTDGLIIVKSKKDLDAITKGLSEIRDEAGQKVCTVYPKSQIYNGDRLESAPDLLILPRDDVTIRSDPFSSEYATTGGDFPRGNHSFNGIFLAAGPNIRKSESLDFRLEDVAPTALELMGVRPPKLMDGKAPDELMAEPFSSSLSPLGKIPTPAFKFSEAEEELVMENLRRLGYA
jgi:predicted AlkP superfamily phosphohydrolase/phosphomutase